MICIYGASDDLIEVDGNLREEIDCYHDAPEGIQFETSDGTKGIISYTSAGTWDIVLNFKGDDFVRLVGEVGEDGSHNEPEFPNATSYSDLLILDRPSWIKIGGMLIK